MPIDYNNVDPSLLSIYPNFNGSNVSLGLQLQLTNMREADRKSKVGDPKIITKMLQQYLVINNNTNSVQSLSIGGAVGGLLGGNGGGIMGAASGVLDTVGGMIKNRPEYSGKHGKITKGMDAAYDATMKAVGMVPGFGLIASLAMGAGKVLNKAIGRLGGGTDGMTKADAILGSNFLGLTPIGLINGFGGKKANTYTRNEELDKSTNGGFSGFLTTQTSTKEGAGKKFGLLSRSAMNKQNELTEFTTNMKHTISGVVDTNTLNNMTALGSIPFLAQQQQVDLNGGIQQMRAARQGMQFSRRVVSKYAIGNKLKRSIQTIDVATGKYVEVPTDLTKEQIQGKVPIRLANGTAVFMNKDGTVSSERWETVGEREHLTPKGEKGLKTPRDMSILIDYANKQNPPFIRRINNNDRRSIQLSDGTFGTHLLSYGELDGKTYVYPQILEIDGNLVFVLDDPLRLAFENGNVLEMSPEEADYFTKHYKEYYPTFFQSFKQGGQMNVIPEGALHARLHHMDNVDPDLAKQITHKGIPVITVEKDGEIVQHAEIEHSEIIFTLEVTNKIEDLRKKYHEDKKDEYAIEAGKILVEEILHNTDDRTNLIANVE